MNKVEVLAPAGNLESLKTAIYNGADAIYLGLNEFNARGNIENFNIDNLDEVVKFAHLFNTKIYLTLNILVQDNEFSEIYSMVNKAISANVDAFIIQDIGLAYFLKSHFPNIELHASTQMGFSSLESVKFAKQIGFKRVVLARETPIEEIKQIKENCDIELEYFVQGALCVCYSGNCYLSSLLTNNSGNRGKCKQLCRLPFSIETESISKEGYLLSTKDFCMLEKLKELVDAGITSIKIEGRARRPAYVGQAVATYKQALENNFSYSKESLDNLKKVFNRGNFANGYLADEKIIYSNTPSHIGLKIGKVVKTIFGKRFNEIFIKSNHQLIKNDTLKFFKNNKEIGILTVQDVTNLTKDLYKVTTKNTIEKNSDVHLIIDSKMEEKTLLKRKFIPLKITFIAKENQHPKIIFETDFLKTSFEDDIILSSAKTFPLSKEECFAQFSKLESIFKLKKLTCDIDKIFIAKSQFNEFRRKALSFLKEKIIENYNKLNGIEEKKHKSLIPINLTNEKTTPLNAVLINNFQNIEKLKKNFDLIIIEPNQIKKEEIVKFYERYKDINIYISLPIIANSYEISYIKSIIQSIPNWGIYANNYYALQLAKPEKTIIGSNLNICNSYSTKFYSLLGYDKLVLSIENFDMVDIKNNSTNLFMYKDFYPNYMYFKHCPFKEHLESDCLNCTYTNGTEYKLNNKRFNLVRHKIFQCQFILKEKHLLKRMVPSNFSTISEML